jgi:micrococcal nuclease
MIEPAYCYRAFITKVIDGDSLYMNLDLGFDVHLRRQSCRLYGLDTAEKRGYKDNPELKQLGILATEFVKNEVQTKGPMVTVRTQLDDQRGKFGRILVEVFFPDDEDSLNHLLLRERLAVGYYGQGKGDIFEAHMANAAYHQDRGTLYGEG